ncbi:MAG: anti-toxin [Gammaproteobacteria bacterium]|jgi:RHH-type rel operon transcriptional repressor/antitoxin RelB|nr:anti-toxin [Gammaproteobacteria bacterium]
MVLKALPVKIPEEIYNRLSTLANKTHRTKTFYVREALLSYLEDLEDTYLALQALEEPGRNYSMVEVAREMGLTKDEEKELGVDD